MIHIPYHTSRNQRSNLADQIERYWVGCTTSNVGLQYLDHVDGKLEKGRYAIERTDVLLLQDLGFGCNIFIEVDGDYSIQPWKRSRLTQTEQRRALAAIRRAIKANAEYMERERVFLTTKPWTEIYGMTPEDGVAHLRSLGW